MTTGRVGLLTGMMLLGCACTQAPSADAGKPEAPAASAVAPVTDAEPGPKTAGEIDFPVIPQIVVPDIVGIGPAQRKLESSMQGLIDPIAGISVRPANCAADGALVTDAGITSVDAQGNLLRNGDEGIFRINADGSGTANYGGGLITVNADGSGTINGSGEDGADDALISVEADGSGSYNGRYGIIRLDGQGGGTWNGDSGLIRNNGDGSGTWNGPQGIVTINADGSGSWNGPHGLVVNDGDGNGRIGAPAREVKMAPIPSGPREPLSAAEEVRAAGRSVRIRRHPGGSGPVRLRQVGHPSGRGQGAGHVGYRTQPGTSQVDGDPRPYRC